MFGSQYKRASHAIRGPGVYERQRRTVVNNIKNKNTIIEKKYCTRQ